MEKNFKRFCSNLSAENSEGDDWKGLPEGKNVQIRFASVAASERAKKEKPATSMSLYPRVEKERESYQKMT